MGRVVVGLDAGTTSAKAVVLDADGALVAEAASRPIATRHPAPGAAEQDARELWLAMAEASRLASQGGGDRRVAALALAAQSGSVVPVDAAGPVGPVITWMDTRSAAVVGGWSRETCDRVRAASGWSPSPGLGLATIAWLGATADPAARYASVDSFLVHQLTGQWITNPSNAAGMQLMDVGQLEWSDELSALAGVAVEQLPAIRPSGARLGHLHPEAAGALGLDEAVPVVAGGHDQACAALALGIVEPGQVMVSAGTAWVLTTPVEHGDVGRLPASLNLGAHVVPARWLASTNLGAIGALLDWWRDECGATHGELEADLEPGIQSTDPCFVPAAADTGPPGGHFSPDAADATLAEPSRGARTRAVVEAAAFQVRAALHEVTSGGLPDALTFVGGAAGNRALVQLLADVTGTTVVIPDDSSWPARGAAILASEALGWRRAPAPVGERFVPDAAATARHGPRYDVYRRLSGGTP